MSISYQWKIERIEAAPVEGKLQNVVKSVAWRLYATDSASGVSSDAWGSIDLGPANPKNFSSYDSLTENEVAGWIEESLNAQNVLEGEPPLVEQIKANLARRVAEQLQPAKVDMDLPWS